MTEITRLLDNNRYWAFAQRRSDPDFFWRLAERHRPRVMWIGCADSRVPAAQVTGLVPGEIFEHRNFGNIVGAADFNLLAAVQYAIDDLRVEHIVVCGHHRCAAAKLALNGDAVSQAGRWIRPLAELAERHRAELRGRSQSSSSARLIELNVIHGVENLAQSEPIRDAWARNQRLSLHGWVYGTDNGLINDLGISTGPDPGAARSVSLAS